MYFTHAARQPSLRTRRSCEVQLQLQVSFLRSLNGYYTSSLIDTEKAKLQQVWHLDRVRVDAAYSCGLHGLRKHHQEACHHPRFLLDNIDAACGMRKLFLPVNHLTREQHANPKPSEQTVVETCEVALTVAAAVCTVPHTGP